VKLRNVEIEGFRGAPKTLTVKLGAKSLFIYSENGRGKSTIADALEFLTTADLADFHREECGIDAAVNVNATGPARISAGLTEPTITVSRELEGETISPLDTGGEALEIPPIPLLRQSTINQFMQRTSGEKREALLELLDLDALNEFRRTLRRARGTAKERREAADLAHEEEKATLEELLGGKELLPRATELAKTAGLEATVASEEDLAALKLKLPPGEPNRQAPLTDLTRALESMAPDSAVAWDKAVADAETRSAEALGTLLEGGRRLLESDWTEDSCPLCEVEQNRAELNERIRVRAEALAESKKLVADLRKKLQERRQSANALAEALRALLAVAPSDGWPSEAGLEAARKSLLTYATEIGKAAADFDPCPANPDLALDFAKLMPELHTAAAPKESPELAALQSLNELQGQRRRVKARAKRAERTLADLNALKRLLEIADEKIKAAVEESLSGIEDLVARYFSILMSEPVYTNVKLIYAARRSGQVEFSIDFGVHTVKPPQRIMSESQLNALGLALLLARVKSTETPWRTLVLDDVVNSFDSPHRAGLIRLLLAEFADWQVLVLSHDSVFRDIALREASGKWTVMEIINWTPLGGPVLGDGDPLKRLEQALTDGEAASALGGHARKALELSLSRAVDKLGYKIPYDPAARYTANDLLQALAAGLKEKKSSLAGVDILDRIDTAGYMTTRAVHMRPDAPEASIDDLKRLVADVIELEEALRCADCNEPAWFARSKKGNQCKCGKLTA
jgi:DNA repair exonuclease SbcCD ATPase subunit